MPIYGYACKTCEHTFDALQKLSDALLIDCPECGEASLRKQLSAPKFRLKGRGWYETDFKTGDKKNLAGETDGKDKDKDKEGKADDAKSGDAKPKDAKSKDVKASDSKPAAKSDSKKSSSDNKAKPT